MDIAGMHYLYVEDDPLSRQVMQMILELGIGAQRVTLFEDSADFADRLASLDHLPDIALLDVQMQPLSGLEMIAILRRQPGCEQVPVVALTASVMQNEIEELRKAGFNGMIAKPVSVTTFPDLIREVLAGKPVWHVG